MSVIKSIYGKLLDWAGLANVPAALTALSKLQGEAGKLVGISTVDESGVVTGFEAVEKPSGEDSGENSYELPIGGEELGGVKNGGNVTINADGTMDAPDNTLTNEQVRTALDGYIADNPDAITAGATAEQAAQIGKNASSVDTLTEVQQVSALYPLDMSRGHDFTDGYAMFGSRKFAFGGYHYMKYATIWLRKGDMLITNADSYETSNETSFATGYPDLPGVVAWKATSGVLGGNSGDGVEVALTGRSKYDGLFQTYVATEDNEYLGLSYKYDVDYDVKFYIAQSRSGELSIPLVLNGGYINDEDGSVVAVSDTSFWTTGYNGEVYTDMFEVAAAGKYLLVRNTWIPTSANRRGFAWATYAEDGVTLERSPAYGQVPDDQPYYIVPLINDVERVRLDFMLTGAPQQYTEALVVDKEFLVRNGYADKALGLSMAVFGDSYVAGSGSGDGGPWHKRFALPRHMTYTNLGHGGYRTSDLVKIMDEIPDADYIGIQCGRNDYNFYVQIGTNDDLTDPTDTDNEASWTTKGNINYMCQYLVEKFPSRKIFFLTPWYFPDTKEDAVQTPKEIIDAILEVTGLWGIPCFDAARRSGIHVKSEAFRAIYFKSADDVSHLNDAGMELMLGNITGWLMSL